MLHLNKSPQHCWYYTDSSKDATTATNVTNTNRYCTVLVWRANVNEQKSFVISDSKKRLLFVCLLLNVRRIDTIESEFCLITERYHIHSIDKRQTVRIFGIGENSQHILCLSFGISPSNPLSYGIKFSFVCVCFRARERSFDIRFGNRNSFGAEISTRLLAYQSIQKQ